MLDPRDSALQASFPTIAAPRFGPLPPMEHGQRLVHAANGVFLQVQRNWIACTRRIGYVDHGLPLPYGCVSESLILRFGTFPTALLRQFIEAARAALPDEEAGALIWSERSGRMRLAIHQAGERSANRIAYRMPVLERDEALVLDVHSHGAAQAYFSREDDEDDAQGAVKLAMVFGNVDRPEPSAVLRLCMNGVFRPLPHPWAAPARAARTSRRLLRAAGVWTRMLAGRMS